ncbi:hypothetical protein QUA43_29975 [Microcoleus sp. N9_B4]
MTTIDQEHEGEMEAAVEKEEDEECVDPNFGTDGVLTDPNGAN